MHNKKIVISVLIILLAVVFPSTCLANSAEPPAILVIVSNAPDNLEMDFISDGICLRTKTRDNCIEKYYIFYSSELKSEGDYLLKVKTNDYSYEVPIEGPLKAYNNIFTLDVKNRTLTSGKLLPRTFLLVTLRIAITLIIEALIFYFMGYRHKKSWIVFFIINIITQGALNVWLNAFSPVAGYIIIPLILGETLIFIMEFIGFLIFVNEHRRLRTFLFVMIANILSLIAGGYLITILPV